MDDSTDKEEQPDGMRNPAKPSAANIANEQTVEYARGAASESVEMILTGVTLLSEEVAVPARLGKYEIHSEIGRGGMGVVWKGFDPDLHRTVAIKVLSPHLSQSQVARRRFQREARAAAAISHENVLTIHSVEEQGVTPFLVMEFVPGQSLKEYISDCGKLTAIEVIRLGAQIAQGLAAAHVQGVIHRDVKPANVMLHDGATRVRLMDFGLARVAFDNSDLTSHDHTVGTPAYMAPEQIRGGDVDARADLFSLGCVLSCMLTGFSPFQGRNHAETIHKIIDLVPAPLHDVDPSVPVVLSEMIEKLLKKNPDERYQSAFEVAETLCRLLAEINQTRTAELGSVLDRLGQTKGNSSGPAPNVGPSKSSRRVVASSLIVAGVAVIAAFATSRFWPGTFKGDSPAVTQTGPNAAANGNASTNGNVAVQGNAGAQASVAKPGDAATKSEAIGTLAGAPKLTRIIVGTGPDATCATLGEAVQRAAVNCTITVMGPGPFVESVKIEGSSLDGLTLIAKPRARLRNSGAAPAVLSIKGVSGVTIDGFDFDVDGSGSHGLHVSGDTAGVTVRNCSFSQLNEDSKWSLIAVSARAKDADSLIRIENCRFESRGGAMCLSVDAGDGTAPNLTCERCQFSAPFTVVYATPSVRRLRLAGNIFVGGTNGINLNIEEWFPASRVEVVNNTFLGTKYWLGFVNSFRGSSIPTGKTDSRVCNNLILGGERVQAGEDQLELVLNTWRFSANWWEQDETTQPDAGWRGRIAQMHPRLNDLPFRNLRDEKFLVPTPGSPLLTSGCGDDLPGYIGANGPAVAASP